MSSQPSRGKLAAADVRNAFFLQDRICTSNSTDTQPNITSAATPGSRKSSGPSSKLTSTIPLGAPLNGEKRATSGARAKSVTSTTNGNRISPMIAATWLRTIAPTATPIAPRYAATTRLRHMMSTSVARSSVG